MKRSVHKAEIGYRDLRWKFFLEEDARRGEWLVKIDQRVHKAIPLQLQQVIVHERMLSSFISHLAKARQEITETRKKLAARTPLSPIPSPPQLPLGTEAEEAHP